MPVHNRRCNASSARRRLEDAWDDDGKLLRPVIRLPGMQTLFTRIDPDNRATSMVFKLRWGFFLISFAVFLFLAFFLPILRRATQGAATRPRPARRAAAPSPTAL